MNKKITEMSEEMKNELINVRRYLHENAETGFDLTKTVAFVKQKLTEYGCQFTDCGKNGIVCVIGKKEGKTILLRADMDALPMEEKTNLQYAGKNGNMHACGHDLHTAMLLGAAKILKSFEDELQGQVKLMFQPAEEVLAGAGNMIENGVLCAPDVDGAFMLHVLSGVPFESGTVIVSSEGVSAPAADYFTINVHGKSCHGSSPHLGVDALVIASHIVLALQEISSREMGMQDKAVLTIGCIRGGVASNVIADTVSMQGTLRSFSDELRETIKKRVTEISESVAKGYRGKADVTIENGCPTLVNDGELSQFTENALNELLGKEKVMNSAEFKDNSLNGSEDFSYISHKVPAVMVALSAGEKKKGYNYSLHHPLVTFDEAVLPIGASIYSYMAIKYLQSY